MTSRDRYAILAVYSILLFAAVSAGYRIGAHSVPALQVTVQAPRAPIVIVSPAEYSGAIVSNGDLEQNTFTSSVASCTSPRPKPQDIKMGYVNGERIK